MDEHLQQTINEGNAPALKFLMKNGIYYSDIVSSYPTMSVTIDSTLLTGEYANAHKIPGLIWFNNNENRIINYGTGKQEVIKQGIKQVVRDSMINLNKTHLSSDVSTIYEYLSKEDLQAASINGLVYRGNNLQKINIPKIASSIKVIPNNLIISGPPLMSFGSLLQYNPKNNTSKHIWRKMGFNNQFTANELSYYIIQDKLPPFTLAYFPDMDREIHDNGPKETKAIEKMDKQLQLILNSYKTWDEAIQQAIWIVYGDSGQSLILHDRAISLIDLQVLVNKYSNEKIKNNIQLAVNERMAYIYLVSDQIPFSEIIAELKNDTRIGFIAWKENNVNNVITGGFDEPFTFTPDGKYMDSYNQSWEINGDFSILNLTLNKLNEIQYGDYPDALARLHGALHSHEGRFIIVDAKPGYEFIAKHSPTHVGGGGHGSLHKDDSLTPLLIVGTDNKPEYNRLVDFKNWILNLILKEDELK